MAFADGALRGFSKAFIFASSFLISPLITSFCPRNVADFSKVALSAAAAEGDRSENAEYIYRKKELGGIDRRLRYLQKRIPVLNVVDRVGDASRVFFGALVTLEGVDGTEVEYRIVGADEIDSDSNKGYISLDSPMARAMLKKSVDDEVKLQLGDRADIYTISRICYTER